MMQPAPEDCDRTTTRGDGGLMGEGVDAAGAPKAIDYDEGIRDKLDLAKMATLCKMPVITTASARMVANPEQLPTRVGSVEIRAGFQGFSLAETFVLNRYRRTAL